MTKLIGVFITGVLFLTGCGNSVSNQNNEETKKKSRIEVHSAQNDAHLITIDDQNTINQMKLADFLISTNLNGDSTPICQCLMILGDKW